MSAEKETDDDFIEQRKVNLQEEKQDKELSLKEKQLAEDIRKNKAAEAQKQKELAIKRQQAAAKKTESKTKTNK
jgi:hypothetical protein